MVKVLNYRDLIAWQRAMELAEHVYALSAAFPADERFGLTSQLRRSAVSIPSNIAEGQGRKSTKEFQHHLSIAHGSVRELETQVLLAQRLKFTTKERGDAALGVASEVGRLINGLYNSL